MKISEGTYIGRKKLADKQNEAQFLSRNSKKQVLNAFFF